VTLRIPIKLQNMTYKIKPKDKSLRGRIFKRSACPLVDIPGFHTSKVQFLRFGTIKSQYFKYWYFRGYVNSLNCHYAVTSLHNHKPISTPGFNILKGIYLQLHLWHDNIYFNSWKGRVKSRRCNHLLTLTWALMDPSRERSFSDEREAGYCLSKICLPLVPFNEESLLPSSTKKVFCPLRRRKPTLPLFTKKPTLPPLANFNWEFVFWGLVPHVSKLDGLCGAVGF